MNAPWCMYHVRHMARHGGQHPVTTQAIRLNFFYLYQSLKHRAACNSTALSGGHVGRACGELTLAVSPFRIAIQDPLNCCLLV